MNFSFESKWMNLNKKINMKGVIIKISVSCSFIMPMKFDFFRSHFEPACLNNIDWIGKQKLYLHKTWEQNRSKFIIGIKKYINTHTVYRPLQIDSHKFLHCLHTAVWKVNDVEQKQKNNKDSEKRSTINVFLKAERHNKLWE